MPALIKHPRPLLLLSACLVGSAVVASNDGPGILAPAEQPHAIQVAMLEHADDTLHVNFDDAALTGGVARDGIGTGITGADGPSAEPVFTEMELARLRELFLLAEAAVDDGDAETYANLSAQLQAYPLYPYLKYRWLSKHLDDGQQVEAYLQEHASSRYAPQLRRQWLRHLAGNGDWQAFLQHYTHGDDTGMQCYYFTALQHAGDERAALDGAAALWVAGRSQPKACDPLFEYLQASDRFDAGLFWRRFEAAMHNSNTRLARYVKSFMSAEDQATATLWLRLHHHPERHLPKLLVRAAEPRAAAMFAHAMYRLAGSDVTRAIELWDGDRERFMLSDKQTARLEKRLAMQLAFDNDAGAYRRLGELDAADDTSKGWRVRLALSEQDWPRVLAAIDDLGEAGRQREKWLYWRARALLETGAAAEAGALFDELAEKRDFHGYLAAQRQQKSYQLAHEPLQVAAHKIAAVANRQAFRAAYEFRALDRDRAARLQWWHGIGKLDDRQVAAAARLAHQWQWHGIAILTIARIEHWDDIELRFPTGYADKIREQAMARDIDPVLLFGIIRRESAFNKDAHSPAGARGLMQLMPRTARQVARELNERWQGSGSLFDPATNLEYGAYYYRKLLDRYDGHYALALAAYNAGPHRVQQWLPDTNLPADIWIETIPYRETRDYVTSVLVYAMIYRQIMQAGELTMNDFTREVGPSTEIALN